MSGSILSRRAMSSVEFSEGQSSYTHEQIAMDAALANFSRQAGDISSLAAMSVGSFAFRFARLGFLEGASSLRLLQVAPRFTQGLAYTLALGTEVSAFRTVNHILNTPLTPTLSPGERVSGRTGEGGGIFDVDGWRGTFTDFLALKAIGHLGAGQNLIVTHMAQSNAMVIGHELSASFGFTTHEEGSYLDRLVRAEITNIQMGAGMALMGMATGGRVQAYEQSLDAQLHATQRSNLSLVNNSSSLPPSLALNGPRSLSALELKAEGSLPNVLQMSTREAHSSGVASERSSREPKGFDMWGERLFEASKSSWWEPWQWRSPFRILQDRILNAMLRDEATKKRMIGFLDVATNSPDSQIPGLLRKYFPQGGQNSRGLLRLALDVGISSWVPESLVVWGIRQGLKGMAKRFLAGETTEVAIQQAHQWRKKGIQATLDVVQENVVSVQEANHYMQTVLKLIRDWKDEKNMPARTAGGVPIRHVSVKLSGLTHRLDPLAHDWALKDASSRLLEIFKEAKTACDAGAPVMVNVDLEDYAVRDLSYDILWKALTHSDLEGWQDAAVVVQAYYKESEQTLRSVLENAERHGKKIQVRLVKGAYHSYEQIRSERNGWKVPVYLTQAETDQNFRRLAERALEKHAVIHVAIGSHNLEDMAYVQARRAEMNIPLEAVEHQFLRGVGNHLARAVIQYGIPARFYGPFGSMSNGLGYMVRRLDEVKLNSAIGETHTAGSWPAYRARRKRVSAFSQVAPAPHSFVNEPETDFSKASVREAMASALKALEARFPLPVHPLIGGDESYPRHREMDRLNVNPGNWPESVSEIWNPSASEVERSVQSAQAGYAQWSQISQSERSRILNRAADLVRERQYEIAAYLVKEAGKPWNLALAEVHEGIDFLRAYALDALEVSQHREALGVGIAISPFNFPFAIALGEVAGGLALGNAMILKPSEQTPAVGQYLVEILREAGVPPEALQFLPGEGKEVGQALVEHEGVDFVVFTGSKNTAGQIMETARLNPPRRHGNKLVVAETGGKNAMIVDETADLDVAVKAILDGAFLMSGQRCSATSRVFVVESVADALMKRLIEGARSMMMGDPSHPETQVGPQIDQRAFEKVKHYLDLGARWGKAHAPSGGSSPPPGHYIGPWIFEGGSPQERFAQEEIFGPALAVMKVKNVGEAIDLANQSPYGLTAGLISRDPTNILQFLRRILAGNAYVNRSQVGAMVRRQPFGGAKDSGTGPQAGGRFYVGRLGRPRRAAVPPQKITFTSTPSPRAALNHVFGNDLENWRHLPPQERILFARAVAEELRSGEDYSLNEKTRHQLVQRIEGYAQKLESLLTPQTTLATPGEINESIHDWSHGTALLWERLAAADSFISDTVAALIMGNGVILPSSLKTELVQKLMARVCEKENWKLPLHQTRLSSTAILNDEGVDVLVAHGPFASNVFSHFLPQIAGKVGFRRTIGGSFDDPDDPHYLSRFASARIRTEETLRHGAELNLR